MASPSVTSADAPSASKPIDYTRPNRSAQPALSGSRDLSAPTSPAKIDFTRPNRQDAPAATSTPAPTRGASSSLDLSSGPAPARAPAPPASTSDSLDLSDAPAAPPAARQAAQQRPASNAPRVHQDVRVRGRDQHLLGVKTPTVTLTRMQSGVGHLGIEAVCSPDVGDLRLGAVYELRSGGSSTVQHAGGHRFAPPSSRRPVIVATTEEYERISLDLRQVRDVKRIAIYAFSESRTELSWGGTLVLTTFGGARVELPLETLYSGRIAVLMSIYNLDGELVIRAEMETIDGDVREAARAYGFDRITWRDDRIPVD